MVAINVVTVMGKMTMAETQHQLTGPVPDHCSTDHTKIHVLKYSPISILHRR